MVVLKWMKRALMERLSEYGNYTSGPIKTICHYQCLKETFILESSVVRKSFSEIFAKAIPIVKTRSWPSVLYRNDLLKHKAHGIWQMYGF
jgi:hypothetical protein